MKKIFKKIQIPLAIALFFVFAGMVFAAECGDMVKCAVCGKEMKKADAKITYVYKEKTYYFASEKCKEAFVKEPEKFLQAKCCMKDMVCCAVCGKGMKKARRQDHLRLQGEDLLLRLRKMQGGVRQGAGEVPQDRFFLPDAPRGDRRQARQMSEVRHGDGKENHGSLHEDGRMLPHDDEGPQVR